MIDVFESAVEPNGRYGAVFEQDNETAYFYLLDFERPEGRHIIEALNLHSLMSLTEEAPAAVVWGAMSGIVGLMVDGNAIAVFDLTIPSPNGRPAKSEDMIYFKIH